MTNTLLTTLAFILIIGSTSRTHASILSEVMKIIGSSRQPQPVACMLCNLGISTFLTVYHSPYTSEDDARNLAIGLCLQLKTHSEQLCNGLVDNNMEAIQYILDNRPHLTAETICATIFQGENCGHKDPSLDWAIDLGELPPSKPHNATTAMSSPLTIVQLTDIHFDPKYMKGGKAVCNEPVCCRRDQGMAETAEGAAGKWGDYRGCDMPWEAVTNALAHIRQQHKHIDYVYMTGDLVDHAIWDTSVTSNNDTFKRVIDEIKKTFQDIPVFPCLGNHESHPVNIFAPSSVESANISSRWLYAATADLWSTWLPADTRATILKGGYYTTLVRPGLRVVALNSNHCHVYNFWLLYDARDPEGQLQWLVGVLRRAEAIGEKVHVLHHISPGNADCYKIWSREFNRIISRFASTVTAQFSGHTHFDEFQLFYSIDEPDKAVNVLYNGGSLTTYKDVNPNYKVYTVDANDLTVLDHETWIYNITSANLKPDQPPEWYKMYSFREAYKVDSLAPQDLDKLAHQIALDKALLKQHFRFYNLLGDPKLAEGCDQECGEELLCNMVMADSGDWTQCDQIIAEFRLSKRIRGEK